MTEIEFRKGMGKMLDKKDLEAIEKILNQQLRQSENLILNEIERTRSVLEGQIAQVKKESGRNHAILQDSLY